MINFEQFTNIGGSYACKISIRTTGTLGFSQGALRRFNLEAGDWFFTLHYAKDEQIIGLRPTQDKTVPNIVRLQRRSVTNSEGRTNVSAQVAARAFFDYYGIPYGEKVRSFNPTMSDEHKMILIDLKNPRAQRGGEPEEEEDEPLQE